MVEHLNTDLQTFLSIKTKYCRKVTVGDYQKANHNIDWQGVKILEKERNWSVNLITWPFTSRPIMTRAISIS